MSKKELVESQKSKVKSPRPKVVKWEYVTEPEDEFVLETDIRRIHSPLKPSLSRGCCGALYLHLRSCVQGLSEKGKPVKTLYCTRDGRFFTRTKDGWDEIKPNATIARSEKRGGNSGIAMMRHFGHKYAHRCVAFAWCNPPKEVIKQVSDDNLGGPNANQQSVCGGEEPRHTSPLCRPAASDATVLPKAWEVDHLNTDHKNWTADNLQWVTVEENRRRGKIARRMRKIGLDPKRLTPTLCRGIYSLPDGSIPQLVEQYLKICANDESQMLVENIRINVATALDAMRT